MVEIQSQYLKKGQNYKGDDLKKYIEKIAKDELGYVGDGERMDNSAKFAFAEISLKRGTVFSATALRRSEGNNIHSRHYSTPELEMEI